MNGFDGFGGFAVVAVSVVTASPLKSAPVEGQQQQLKTTSDVTSKFPWCCRASVEMRL